MKDKRFVVAVSNVYCDVFVTVLESRKGYINYCRRKQVQCNPANTRAICRLTSKKDVVNGTSHSEIVFSKESVDAELITHECFHAVYHSFNQQRIKLSKNEETFAILLGELVLEVTSWLAL